MRGKDTHVQSPGYRGADQPRDGECDLLPSPKPRLRTTPLPSHPHPHTDPAQRGRLAQQVCLEGFGRAGSCLMHTHNPRTLSEAEAWGLQVQVLPG